MKKYKPSNGTEGELFINRHCANCVHENSFRKEDGKKFCGILSATLTHEVNDKKYPTEWQYIDDKPTCTKFERLKPVCNYDIKTTESKDPKQLKLL
jgi:hypothetical protein